MESITPWYIIVRDYQARAVVSGGPAVSREHRQYRENIASIARIAESERYHWDRHLTTCLKV